MSPAPAPVPGIWRPDHA